MKPKILKIKGLHSYLEEQTIDFEKLTEKGLFGIFGATASGKSTILDGMIYALYGIIPRNSKEIVNAESSELSVYFAFGLNKEGKRQTYECQRTITRKKNGELNTPSANIRVTCDGNTQVLADKIKEVNAKVIEVIGLEADDFMRSVVLPQGKFSEFLSLTGTERRNMLERIFGLEKYGQRLTQTLNKRKNHVLNEKSNVLGRLSAYEGVSEELLKQMEQKEATLIVLLEKYQKELEKASEDLEKNKIVWSIQLELEDVMKEKSRLDLTREKIEKDRVCVVNGKKANQMKPLWQEEELLKSLIETTAKEIQNRNEKIKDWEKSLGLAQTIFEKAQEEKEKNKIPLSSKLAQLEQSTEKQKLLNELNKKIKALIQQFKILEEAIEKQKQLILRYKEKQEKLEAEALDLAERKEKVMNAKRAFELSNMAAALSNKLEEGTPCPVCGSTQHPQLAAHGEQSANSNKSLGEMDREIDFLTLEWKRVEKERVKVEKERKIEEETMNQNKDQVNEIKIKGEGLRGEEKILKKELEGISDGKDLIVYASEIKTTLEQINKQYTESQENYDKQKECLEKQKQELAKIQGQEEEKKQQWKQVQDKLKKALQQGEFESLEIAKAQGIEETVLETMEQKIQEYDRLNSICENRQQELNNKRNGVWVTEAQWLEIQQRQKQLQSVVKETEQEKLLLTNRKSDVVEKLKILVELQKEQEKIEKQLDLLKDLGTVLGANRFAEYLANTELKYIAKDASYRLKDITKGRYALEIDENSFVIRDDFNGGKRRSTATLSGGETFFTALSLALALSSKTQMRGNSAPMEFFFLDEGFGSLDSELLDIVMKSLEKLYTKSLSVGIISHVEELKNRVPVKLMVIPATMGEGTKVKLEYS